ncbi:hypothetical protein BV25DRAFT_1372956 [Artomyces pyxidatus]|uniref:Uncharacterized protein n=1 Tax=Artomyces pyxidatus TaxID=48021 RepID=A0ACB8TD90_9AGAM|nr:hypothetical protein BV25DRAFT_1372956 [Artomyces pyxidatus]
MKPNTVLSFLTIVTATLFSPVASEPSLLLEKRAVWAPAVLYPHSGTVWNIGDQHSVVWDTSTAPSYISNPTGTIMLQRDSTAVNITLASGFSILDGRTEVNVPSVLPGATYYIVLVGTSGNRSPDFTIDDA